MFCPQCKAEYRDGFYVCTDCNVQLVTEIPSAQVAETPVRPDTSQFEKIFETEDSYEFLDACKVLEEAGIPFAGDERYTGEFRATKRAQAPYVWTILVAPENKEEAVRLLGEGSR